MREGVPSEKPDVYIFHIWTLRSAELRRDQAAWRVKKAPCVLLFAIVSHAMSPMFIRGCLSLSTLPHKDKGLICFTHCCVARTWDRAWHTGKHFHDVHRTNMTTGYIGCMWITLSQVYLPEPVLGDKPRINSASSSYWTLRGRYN